MNIPSWTVATALLACPGCAVLGGLWDHAPTYEEREFAGACPMTKVGAVADVVITGIMIVASAQSHAEEPPDNYGAAIFGGVAGAFAVSAVSGFAGWTCQDGYFFGTGRKPEEPAAPPRPAPIVDDPVAPERRECARGVTASCARLFSLSDSPVVQIDAGTRACTGDPTSGLCDEVAALLQPTDPARGEELLRLGCRAHGPDAAASCAPLGWIDAHRTDAVAPDHAALRQRCLARENGTCAELGRRIIAVPAP